MIIHVLDEGVGFKLADVPDPSPRRICSVPLAAEFS